jgi:ketosteroid isomerase-like protein
MSHEQTVRDVHAAFQRQDIPAILAHVANDVDWRAGGLARIERLAGTENTEFGTGK